MGPLCVGTSLCRVVDQLPGEPSRLRLHFVLDEHKLHDLRATWMHAAMYDGLIDCRHNATGTVLGHVVQKGDPTPGGLAGEFALWSAGPFAPARSLRADEAELAFFVQDGSSYLESGGRIPLKPCLGLPVATHLELVGEGFDYEWRAAAGGATAAAPLAPVTVSDLLSSLSSRAVVVAALALIPDIMPRLVKAVGRWFAKQGIADRSRVAVLHYRSGIIPTSMGGISDSHLPGSQLTGSRLMTPHQFFWNNMWRSLAWSAQKEARLSRCELGADGTTRRCGADALAAWCIIQPPLAAPASRPKSLLLLGGDAANGRRHTIKALYEGGALDNALWSLQTPPECGHVPVPPDWSSFCQQFPKVLDIPLRGDH